MQPQLPHRLFLTLALVTAGCSTQNKPAHDAPNPFNLDQPPVLQVNATGHQIYTWKPDPSGKPAWSFKAPEATFSGNGVTGTHYAGPTWQANDGSKVVAKKIAEKPSPDANSVPWLLLQATKHEGDGILSTVSWIVRLDTTGGKPPTTAGAKQGDEIQIPYTAKYLFYPQGATTQPVPQK